jgi:hypothetical protein
MKPKQLEWSLSGHEAFYYADAFECQYRLWRRVVGSDDELCVEFWIGKYSYRVIENGYHSLERSRAIAQAHHDKLWLERAENEVS